MKEWSKNWKKSKNPRKQRKYRHNAPLHIKGKFLSAHLSKELRKKNKRRSMRIRKGDKIIILRGQFKKLKGEVNEVNLKNGKVTLKIEKKSGQELKNLKTKTLSKVLHFKNKKGYLVVSVADSGIGISLEDQRRLFTRFFRSKKVMQSEAEGTGLGLYIAKSIINLHGGDIWFESELGQGSIFYFSLPII